MPDDYPRGTDFHRADFDSDVLPWPEDSFDAITCMHVVEHLRRPHHLIAESARVLRNGGRIYIETPHPRSETLESARGAAVGQVTLNFYDDPTHVKPVEVDSLRGWMRENGLNPTDSGTSRNLLFSAAYPLYRLIGSTSRQRYVAQLHFTGWSSYVIGEKT